jgi:uncharacterized protein YuzE
MATTEPKITLGDTVFDRVVYDRDADVLYLHVGDPQRAVDFDESPEGHALRYDATGHLVGVTIVNARRLIESEGALSVTLPTPTWRIEAHAVAEVLGLTG